MKDKELRDIQQGSKLAMAVKSPAGQIIIGSAMEGIEQTLLAFLNPTVTDEEILAKRHAALGIVLAFGVMEQRIKIATGLAARHTAKAIRADREEEAP